MDGESRSQSRRKFLKTSGLVAGLTATAVTAPWVRRAGAADAITWKIQTSWPAGVGLETFQNWCGTIKEKTGGQLEFQPFKAKDIVGDFELLDGVKNGVLEAMNSFSLYWAGKLPATAFLSSYTLGLRYPHEWDIFFYAKGGLQA
ncbi:twin-arginine translocation signal domain-containing protein, partial [Mesorhizobium sp. M1A.F.Ca.ET.072.01.1.1]|uniref:twin-arginine translocation signal domain-containing protein n=1 Tax=Mesorhizobium sp. M1A.F.Ca.ET.072.01.1.1 TaxID=2496753 RepID=UPI000FD53028